MEWFVGSIFVAAFLFFCFFALTSWSEHEKRATRPALIFALISGGLTILVTGLPPFLLEIVFYGIIAFLFILTIFLFLPIGKIKESPQHPHTRIDERDIPFARHHLEPNTPEFTQYYKMRPEKRKIDQRIRALPGLLSPDAQLANATAFAAARASFEFIESFREAVEPPVTDLPFNLPPEGREAAIKALAKYFGAHSVGITRVRAEHFYSHVGRGTGRYGDPVAITHSHAIAFTVEMRHEMVRCAPAPPVVMESAKQYVEAARVAMQLALFLRNAGFSARAHIDSNYRVIAPLVARDAGLGEIGRMGLLMTPDLGPRVRIGVVTTDLPLKPDSYQPDFSVIDFCNICKKCAENCPSRSIPFDERKWINGALRWQINSDTCFHYWNVIGTDCCKCMAVCPYSHPNTALHKMVRFGIRKSGLFRRIAFYLDDLFYGRNPEAFSPPEWIPANHKRKSTKIPA